MLPLSPLFSIVKITLSKQIELNIMQPIVTIYRAVNELFSNKAQTAIISADQPYLAEIYIGEPDKHMNTYTSAETGLKLQTTMRLDEYKQEFIDAVIKAVALIADGYSEYHQLVCEESEEYFEMTSKIHLDTATNALYYSDFTTTDHGL
ncbi:hypothetical protein HN283_13820 [Acinetobacter baumannii]|nr:hypothetical protein [Acinetobacter baumannii]MBF6813600.1 hypothetical protein [Acinetobacter baumannii]MBF6914152.1 hypothetical protein [Acinetobacter baumannii]MBF6974591.1 hypothetical protein [Acinetobacter baumannii]MCJ9258811.1 hypothetical protein [Acinetobacter baumannii]